MSIIGDPFALSQDIEKLSYTNYGSWKYQIEEIARGAGLLGVMKGTVVRPDPVPPLLDGPEGNVLVPGNENEGKAWDVKNDQTMSIIGLSLGQDQVRHVRGLTTAAARWEALETLHRPKTPWRKVTLDRQLMATKYKDGTSMRNHLDEMFDITDQIEDMGMPWSDGEIAWFILRSLPDSWSNDTVHLRLLKDDQITSAIVADSLLHTEELRNEDRTGLQNPDTGSNVSLRGFFMDSGVSRHIVRDRSLFKDYTLLPSPGVVVEVGPGKTVFAEGTGSISVQIMLNGQQKEQTFANVLHVPETPANLISVQQILQKGHSVTFFGGGVKVTTCDGTETLAEGTLANTGGYILNTPAPPKRKRRHR